MFNNHTWTQIINSVKNLPRTAERDYMLVTYPGNSLNLIRLRENEVYVADEKHPDSFVHIEQSNFEDVYNELMYNRKLTINDIGVGLKVDGASIIMAVLGILPGIKYDKKENTLNC